MSKKLLNVKYDPKLIATLPEEELQNMVNDLKMEVDKLDEDYVVVFSPFDISEIPDEGVIDHVTSLITNLQSSGKSNLAEKILSCVREIVNVEGETDSE